MQTSQKWKRGLFILAVLFSVATFYVVRRRQLAVLKPYPIGKNQLAEALGEPIERGEFPNELVIQKGRKRYQGKVKYTLDLFLQNKMEKLFKSYKPDYGAFVALDATTGKVLSIVSYSGKSSGLGNLNLVATFPAASVFKIVTSAAALEQGNLKPNSVISFNGANHTLYKRNLTSTNVNRWTRHMTLKEAFAKSVNTVFGKLGIYFVKPTELDNYARKFLFNQQIPADLPVQMGTFSANAESEYKLAELASGFNRIALMSPLQGALIAASVINDGVLMEPYLVESVTSDDQGPIYYASPKVFSNVVRAESARDLRELMHETVKSGTSRVSFRNYIRKTLDMDLELGGKTGSLTGTNPKGKYDWFVGYAAQGDRKIALAALTINEENWKVKSSVVARHCIETYFRPPPKVALKSRTD